MVTLLLFFVLCTIVSFFVVLYAVLSEPIESDNEPTKNTNATISLLSDGSGGGGFDGGGGSDGGGFGGGSDGGGFGGGCDGGGFGGG